MGHLGWGRRIDKGTWQLDGDDQGAYTFWESREIYRAHTTRLAAYADLRQGLPGVVPDEVTLEDILQAAALLRVPVVPLWPPAQDFPCRNVNHDPH